MGGKRRMYQEDRMGGAMEDRGRYRTEKPEGMVLMPTVGAPRRSYVYLARMGGEAELSKERSVTVEENCDRIRMMRQHKVETRRRRKWETIRQRK